MRSCRHFGSRNSRGRFRRYQQGTPLVKCLSCFTGFGAVLGQIIIVPGRWALTEIVGVSVQDFRELPSQLTRVTDGLATEFSGRWQPLWRPGRRLDHVKCVHAKFHLLESGSFVDDGVH